jgi:hypothetical protein
MAVTVTEAVLVNLESFSVERFELRAFCHLGNALPLEPCPQPFCFFIFHVESHIFA